MLRCPMRQRRTERLYQARLERILPRHTPNSIGSEKLSCHVFSISLCRLYFQPYFYTNQRLRIDSYQWIGYKNARLKLPVANNSTQVNRIGLCILNLKHPAFRPHNADSLWNRILILDSISIGWRAREPYLYRYFLLQAVDIE